MSKNEPIGDQIASAIGRWLGQKLVKRYRPEMLSHINGEDQVEPTQSTQPTENQKNSEKQEIESEREAVKQPYDREESTRPIAHDLVDLLLMLSTEFVSYTRPALIYVGENSEKAPAVLEEAHYISTKGLKHINDKYEMLLTGDDEEQAQAETIKPFYQVMRRAYVASLRIRKYQQISDDELPTFDDFASATGSDDIQVLIEEAFKTSDQHPTIG